MRSRPLPILRSFTGWRPAWLAGDVAAGLTLAAIAIPEQMATARLAGLPLAAGFRAFVAGSIAIAFVGRNRWMSVGADSTIAPIIAAGLASVMAAKAGAAGAPSDAAVMGLAAALSVAVGVLLILARVLRMAWLADLLSVPVTTGFLAGIAVRIAAAQLPDLLALQPHATGAVAQIAAAFDAVAGGTANMASCALGMLVFAAVLALARTHHRIPGALLALILAAVAVPVLHLDRLGVTTVGSVAFHMPPAAPGHMTLAQAGSLATLAGVVAVVCIMQTSAVSRAFASDGTDGLGDDIAAVGIGSILAGMIGGFVVDASPPRTAIVQGSGGRTQATSLIAAAVLVILLLFGAGFVARVPHAALAGILLYIAVHLFRIGEMRRIRRESPVEFVLLVATAASIVLLPIAEGIILGIFLSLAYGISRLSRPAAGPFTRVPGTTVWWSPPRQGTSADDAGVLVFGFEGPLIFTSAQYFRRTLQKAIADAGRGRDSGLRLFVLEASGVVDIDYTGARVLEGELAALGSRAITTAIARLESPEAQRAAERLGVLDAVGRGHVYRTVAEAVAALAPGAGAPG